MSGKITQPWIEAFERDVRPMLAPGARVLDYGFGDGRYYEFYLRYFAATDIHGVEASRIRTQTARDRGWANAIFLPLHQPLPYGDCSFDFVNMAEVIEHIPAADIAFYLGEIRRVLKPGGRMLVTTPNYPIKRFYDVIDAYALRQRARLKDDPTHVRRYTPGRLRAVLTPYFKAVDIRPYKFGRLYRFTRHPFVWHKLLAVCA